MDGCPPQPLHFQYFITKGKYSLKLVLPLAFPYIQKVSHPFILKKRRKMAVAAAQVEYEELRQQRMEENKRRMEDLNLTQLLYTLQHTSPKFSPKENPCVVRKEEDLVEVRRSTRVVKRPPPDYKHAIADYVERTVRPRSYKRRRCLLDRVYASDEARLYSIDRANEVQLNLEPEFPSFIKPMLQSHVTGGFWLGLPIEFCKVYLPGHDATVTLIDENGDGYPTAFLAHKKGLSAGWRGFSIAHELVDGDALVFQLVKPTTFKVYIIRASGLAVVDGALNLLNLDVGSK